MSSAATTSNFEFLKEHDPLFFQLASTAEQVFASDPNTTLIKLRQLGEAFAQDIAARCGIAVSESTKQSDLLYQLSREIRLDATIRELFHTLRIEGNKATHQFRTQHKEALDGLRVARALALWFHQSFGKQGASFKPGAFIPPPDPSEKLRHAQAEIENYKAKLREANETLENNQKLIELKAKEAEEGAELNALMSEDGKLYQQLIDEQEVAYKKSLAEFEHKLAEANNKIEESEKKFAEAQAKAVKDISAKTQTATKNFALTEELTRILIDQQLVNAGWLADTQEITYAKGARPEKNQNKAIAEWPTVGGQSADYVLFAGLIPIAVVEAKRKNVDVAGKIPQAERYSRGFKQTDALLPAWQIEGRNAAWPGSKEGPYEIPFVYSCNGQPYLKQLETKSGTWFRDVRSPANIARALQDFHNPNGLLDKLKRSKENAEKQLHQEAFGYLKLRDYQEKAVRALETAIENNQTSCLLAMATGTGKTRTILGLMYRFLKAERFKRILFLVDRTALGTQALDSFKDTPLEQNFTLSKNYNIAELGDMASEAETRIQVATVQAMVGRIFRSDDPPNVAEFDCIIVDEAHRGYTLDQEMTEGEMEMRDLAQYVSTYRRVLDYFDAVKIGLTATPAKHTTDIFGKPVYTYSYREAVADDWLIDHEPPVRYITKLSENGIHFEKGETVSAINTKTGEVETAELEDELNFDVEAFNKRVITEPFNRVICNELAKELDPLGEEKTMIFCATDLHADMVKNLLDQAFLETYGDSYKQDAVKKITGKSDKVDQLIRQYKNERFPTIAITVDLLTTGIDVPTICHLVFMRRVRSRILYEQMIGRATRRCDDIGKTVFKIYDPVDIYTTLQDVNTMKPLVKDPNITIEQLVLELQDPKSLSVPGTDPKTTHADDVLNALNQKIMRVMRKAEQKSEKNKQLKFKLDELEQLWGLPPAKLHQHLHHIGPEKAVDFLNTHRTLLKQLEEVKELLGSVYKPVISAQEDELLKREQSYGQNQKPADYLESFNDFIRNQLNQSVALSVVVNRPKDLTREQLREIKLLLDQHGYSEASLQSAWRTSTQQEIAASIIGYIRRAAIGEALISFEQRVHKAMQHIFSLHPWTHPQRRWLDRLAKSLIHEVVIDKGIINNAFQTDGGAKGLDKILGGQLDRVVEELNAHLWDSANTA